MSKNDKIDQVLPDVEQIAENEEGSIKISAGTLKMVPSRVITAILHESLFQPSAATKERLNSLKDINTVVFCLFSAAIIFLFGLLRIGLVHHSQPSSNASQPIAAPSYRTLTHQPVVFSFAKTTLKVPYKSKVKWFKRSSSKVKVSTASLNNYFNELRNKYNRTPQDQIYTTNVDGSQLVLTNGVNGFSLLVDKQLVQQVTNVLKIGQGANFTIPSKVLPFHSVNLASSANKYLDVNIDTKRMYAYENGKLIKTFLITAGAPLTPTATGNFKIYAKVRIQDMRGVNADGTKYYQPDVEWVSYFNGSDAIHGNYWRPLSYFGSVNSSHGCIGIVNDDARWVYYWAPTGTSVNVHK